MTRADIAVFRSLLPPGTAGKRLPVWSAKPTNQEGGSGPTPARDLSKMVSYRFQHLPLNLGNRTSPSNRSFRDVVLLPITHLSNDLNHYRSESSIPQPASGQTCPQRPCDALIVEGPSSVCAQPGAVPSQGRHPDPTLFTRHSLCFRQLQ